MTQFKAFLRIMKGVYDIVAAYLLGWILLFALVAGGLYFLFDLATQYVPVSATEGVWERVAYRLKISPFWLRIAFFGTIHGLLLYLFRRQLAGIQRFLEGIFDAVAGFVHWATHRLVIVEFIIGLIFTVFVTVMLVPFAIQPTLVSGFDRSSWLERTANLLDGTATVFVGDSVIGFYRRLYAEPVIEESLTAEEATRAFTETDFDPGISGTGFSTMDPTMILRPPRGNQPMMDRWDDHLIRAADGDPRIFAILKAFMWVESAGRQYAVSTTGCSGLMQFCAGTARSQPYRNVFGTGQIYACGCKGPCRIESNTQRRLEMGELDGIQSRSSQFPCELTDARFNATRSIQAARLYIDRLDAAYGGNIYLMYIGYNSGPGIATKVYNALGRDPHADLATIDLHLAREMQPHYGNASAARARSLVNVHLPKLQGAYERYAQAVAEAEAEVVVVEAEEMVEGEETEGEELP
ncbi:MAG: transglycosylase SLT domain-containing protein [Bradymonadaceae bacterium]